MEAARSTPTIDDLISVEETARLFQVTRKTAMEWGRRGFLRRVYLPFAKGYQFDRRQINELLRVEGR